MAPVSAIRAGKTFMRKSFFRVMNIYLWPLCQQLGGCNCTQVLLESTCLLSGIQDVSAPQAEPAVSAALPSPEVCAVLHFKSLRAAPFAVHSAQAKPSTSLGEGSTSWERSDYVLTIPAGSEVWDRTNLSACVDWLQSFAYKIWLYDITTRWIDF